MFDIEKMRIVPMTLGKYFESRGWSVPYDLPKTTKGYKIESETGLSSWMSYEEFRDKYKEYMGLSFSGALELLKQGCAVAREGWNGKGIFIVLQKPDANSKMTHPYIYIDTTGLVTDSDLAPKDRVPWVASQTYLLAEDWVIIL